jgi:steroid delta-isomerase-like uncharacterized protein
MSEDLIAVAREYVEAFSAGDWDRMRRVIAPDSAYDEPATQRRVEGQDAVIEVNEAWKSAFPDAHGTVTGAFACDDRVVMEVVWEGTHSGALQLPGGGEIPPTNRRVSVDAAVLLRIAEGRIAENRHFFDMLGMLDQMGTLSSETLAQED